MNNNASFTAVSPLRFTAVFMGMAAVWLFAPEIAHAAVTFGEIGQNIADNSKGVRQGHHNGGLCRRSGHGRVGHCGHV